MLNINKQSDYGILFVSSLVGKKDYISLSELVKKTKLPKRFLARIAAELARYKIVKSKEGKVGGYKLTKQAENISLYEYLKIFEGELNFVKCGDDNYQCQWEKICSQKDFLQKKLNKIVINELKKWTLKDLLPI